MRGYVLPAILALLLAAPMIWRLDGGAALVRPGDGAMRAGLLFEEEPRDTVAAERPVSEVLPLLPAAAADPPEGRMPVETVQADWWLADEQR